MTKTMNARDVTLHDLRSKFGLQFVQDLQFFPEWQADLPEISLTDKQQLDRVKAGYFNLIEYPPMLENTVKMAVLAPLLHLAGFYLPPFHIKSEQSIRVSAVDEDLIIEGKIDVLVLAEQLWVMVIESKRATFSIEAGLAQLLAYMLASPQQELPTFGMIATGGSFIFVKLLKNKPPQYSSSRIFEQRNPGNDLYSVLAILKKLAQLAISSQNGQV